MVKYIPGNWTSHLQIPELREKEYGEKLFSERNSDQLQKDLNQQFQRWKDMSKELDQMRGAQREETVKSSTQVFRN